MKKFIIFLILAMFFVISCHSSKKTENDADLLPDEDVTDADENEEDEEETDNDEDELEDTDPCDPNPCENIANSDGTCTGKEDDSFECGCVEGYFWANPGCKKITLANICTGQNSATTMMPKRTATTRIMISTVRMRTMRLSEHVFRKISHQQFIHMMKTSFMTKI